MNVFRRVSMITVSAVLLATLNVCSATADDSDEKEQTNEPVALSVAPLDHVEYPLDRPQWIEEGRTPLDSDDSDEVVIAITSGPAPTPEAAVEMMEVMALGAVENYVDQRLQETNSDVSSSDVAIDLDWVLNELVSRRYDGTVKTGDMVQYESACLLRIDGSHQETLHRLVQNHELQGRLAAVGVLGVLCLVGLLSGSIFFGWLSSRQQRFAAG